MELFPKSTAKQRAHLVYGTKVRYIKCLAGNLWALLKLTPNAFTSEEQQTIREITDNALERAKKERDEDLRRCDTTTTQTDSGVASESRQYTGK